MAVCVHGKGKCRGPVTVTPTEFLPLHCAFCRVEEKKVFSEEVQWLANILAVISHLGGKGENGVILSVKKFLHMTINKLLAKLVKLSLYIQLEWNDVLEKFS